MKKIVLVLLACTVALAPLTGCGGKVVGDKSIKEPTAEDRAMMRMLGSMPQDKKEEIGKKIKALEEK
ncbi:MAG TPA: hypothetical protein HPP77_08990 [Candidatus Hydrogenedentes bacterium]|nr:hypothetical protein [Candidatus Hydrogenedentota bacterium]